jgi:hypothetical protein
MSQQIPPPPKKVVSRNVAVALGIICIILIAGLGATMAYYITNLTLELSQLQASLNEIETLLNQSLTPSVAQGVYDGFQLTMTLEKTVYELGNPINISLTLTNISNQTVSFWLDFSFSYFQFLVYNSTGSAIYSSLNNGGALLPLAEDYTLNAGQSISDSYSWDQTWNNTFFSPEGIPVLSGAYYIVGQVGPIYGTNSTIETTPIQVTIV